MRSPASGTVVLQYGSKKTTLTLKSGKAGFKLARAEEGRSRPLVATYKATATTKASSATRTITVR